MHALFLITSSIEDKDSVGSYNEYVNLYIVKPKDIEGLIKILDSFKEFWLNIATLPYNFLKITYCGMVECFNFFT